MQIQHTYICGNNHEAIYGELFHKLWFASTRISVVVTWEKGWSADATTLILIDYVCVTVVCLLVLMYTQARNDSSSSSYRIIFGTQTHLVHTVGEMASLPPNHTPAKVKIPC